MLSNDRRRLGRMEQMQCTTCRQKDGERNSARANRTNKEFYSGKKRDKKKMFSDTLS